MSVNIKPNSKKISPVIIDQDIVELAGGSLSRPLQLNFNGVAGSGKKYAFFIAFSQLQLLSQTAGVPDPAFWLLPTGITVFNYVGRIFTT